MAYKLLAYKKSLYSALSDPFCSGLLIFDMNTFSRAESYKTPENVSFANIMRIDLASDKENANCKKCDVRKVVNLEAVARTCSVKKVFL